VILGNQPGADSWPITASTWVVLYKTPDDAATTGEALKFFDWAYNKGGEMASGLDYVAIPDGVVNSIEDTWAKNIVGADGKPLFAATN
jgi:phosphate transport system substrate-binding protein